jgi:iron transport multicopper oxidase
VHDPQSPYKGQYDEEIVLTMSDHYHASIADLLATFLDPTNPTGAEPIPDSALFDDSQDVAVKVRPGKTYLVRMVNLAGFAPLYLWFEGHTMSIVEVDGIYTEPAETDMIYITPAQRYSVLITTKNDTSRNFAFVGSMDEVRRNHPLQGKRPR